MKIEYSCHDCDCSFPLTITDWEHRTSLEEGRQETCPKCHQRVGFGLAECHACGQRFPLRMGHWHVLCNTAEGDCPRCGAAYLSLCTC
ncbi:MAG: hypothetical protein KC636_27570 [Myxococcales bacterium]|nr:hypothetical protein [Myxococcales bacterium]